MSAVKVARVLGWASLAIGASEIIAPGSLQKLLGVEGHHRLLRSFGLREIMAGVGLLATSEPEKLGAGLWNRVAGDAVDVGSLALAARSTRRPMGLALVSAMVLGITAVDAIYAKRLQPRIPDKFGGRLANLATG